MCKNDIISNAKFLLIKGLSVVSNSESYAPEHHQGKPLGQWFATADNVILAAQLCNMIAATHSQNTHDAKCANNNHISFFKRNAHIRHEVM